MNQITIRGNLTRDPELRFTATAKPVANLSVASNRKWNDKTGNPQETATFFDCVAWGTTAEQAAELHRGDRVLIIGRVEQRSWQTKDGEPRTKLEVIIDDIAATTKPTNQPTQPTNQPNYSDEPF